MGTIRIPIEIISTRSHKRVNALVDTGARRNYLPKTFRDGEDVDSIGFREFLGHHTAILANQKLAQGYRVMFDDLVLADVHLSNPAFVVLDQLVDDAIIGTGLMQQLRMIINLGNDEVQVKR